MWYSESMKNTPTAEFEYRRQYYDSGNFPISCYFCGDLTRFVFLIRSTSLKSTLPTGPCCFHRFDSTYPDIYAALVASETLLTGVVKDTQADVDKHHTLALTAGVEVVWKGVREQAKLHIKQFRKQSGEAKWLPKPLFDLQEALNSKPRKTYKNPLSLARWYRRNADGLQEKLDLIKQ